jgi:putative CocE/NonD family hydrolase
MEDFSVHTFREAVEQSGAAIYGWGGWFDAATADAVIRRFVTLSNPQIGVIGPWNHGATQHAGPYAPGRIDLSEHWNEHVRFFDKYFQDWDCGVTRRILTYSTMGEEKWKTTSVWPPAGSTNERWYLEAGNALSRNAAEDHDGADTYTVDWEATTGTRNRWHTQLGGMPLFPVSINGTLCRQFLMDTRWLALAPLRAVGYRPDERSEQCRKSVAQQRHRQRPEARRPSSSSAG